LQLKAFYPAFIFSRSFSSFSAMLAAKVTNACAPESQIGTSQQFATGILSEFHYNHCILPSLVSIAWIFGLYMGHVLSLKIVFAGLGLSLEK
jgi:hypothetical protein